MTDIGRAGIVMKGDYNSASTYETLDAVSYQNGLYVAKQNVPINTLPTNTTYWQRAIDASDIIAGITARFPRNISNNLSNLITAISEQNLEKYGYKIGDFFDGTSQENNNYRYWLADMDTFYGVSDNYAVINTHHIGLVVDTHKQVQWYNGNDISNVGYAGSSLHSYLSGTCMDTIKADMRALFGGSTGLEHLLSHKIQCAKVNSWEWVDGQYISALSECQVCGCPLWSCDNYQQGEADKKLSLFEKYKYCQILGEEWTWLRSINSSSSACGIASGLGIIHKHGVDVEHYAVGLILFH